MPFDGSGNFTPSAAPNFPAVSGNVIASGYYNNVINDIATGLSNVLTRDGQGKPSANIDWNAKNLTNVATLSAITASFITATFTNALGIASGGTALATVPTNGQLLIGNGTGYTLATLTEGANIDITEGPGTITIACTAAGMTYPAAGIAVSTGAAWAGSLTAPAGAIVGTTDTQTLSAKTINSSVVNLSTTVGTSGTAAANSVGYLGIPQVAKTASYTLALTDSACDVYISGTTAAQTITIPANASVAFVIGTGITISNDSNQNWSIAITSDTLFWSPSGGTGTRTLAAGGKAFIEKKTAARWWITGSGLS